MRKSNLFISSLMLLPALIIIGYVGAAIPAGAEVDVNNPDQYVYMIFRQAIFNSLKDSLNGDTTSLDNWRVMSVAGKALDNAVAGLLKDKDWIKDSRLVEKTSKIANIVEKQLKNADAPLSVKTDQKEDEAIQAYLVDLLGETSPFSRAQAYSNHPLSGYKFIVGGSWTHADSGAAKGIVYASMLFRTRFYDSRGKLDNSLMNQTVTENWYVDLGVDAQFITNTAYNRVTDLTPVGDSLEASEVLLESVTSSKLSMALISGTPLKFADFGTVGPFLRFEISTQEGSGDIFRRMIVGLRFENRSEYAIREATAEVGFTINTAAGSLQSNRIFDLDELKRVVLDFELPIRGQTNRGLYMKFHGEWPIGSKDKILNNASGALEEISPPIYQFQFGALFDPLALFGPLFGLGK